MVSASMLDGIVSNGQIRGYWQYGNEQELIQVLGEMKDVLIKKGMKILVELSKDWRNRILPKCTGKFIFIMMNYAKIYGKDRHCGNRI